MEEGSFYSMDRLVEFGLGAAVATQMANSMNQALGAMRVPGADNSVRDGVPRSDAPTVGCQAFASGAAQQLYYVVLDGTASGPFSLAELARMAGERRLVKETYVWKPGMADWALVEQVDEVLHVAAIAPPPVPGGSGMSS